MNKLKVVKTQQIKIGFVSTMGCGKDTAVDYLIRKYGGTKISFSKYLYDILNFAQNICGFEKEKDRKFLQFIGTEWARNKNPNIWIELVLKSIKEIPENENIFCSDIRFLNELEMLKENKWICIKIDRNVEISQRLGTGDEKHISERELETCGKWDYFIENNGSLDDLYKKIDEIIYTRCL